MLYNIKLASFNADEIIIIDLCMRILGFDASEAYDCIDNMPSIIAKNVDSNKVKEIRAAFESEGAILEVSPAGVTQQPSKNLNTTNQNVDVDNKTEGVGNTRDNDAISSQERKDSNEIASVAENNEISSNTLKTSDLEILNLKYNPYENKKENEDILTLKDDMGDRRKPGFGRRSTDINPMTASYGRRATDINPQFQGDDIDVVGIDLDDTSDMSDTDVTEIDAQGGMSDIVRKNNQNMMPNTMGMNNQSMMPDATGMNNQSMMSDAMGMNNQSMMPNTMGMNNQSMLSNAMGMNNQSMMPNAMGMNNQSMMSNVMGMNNQSMMSNVMNGQNNSSPYEVNMGMTGSDVSFTKKFEDEEYSNPYKNNLENIKNSQEARNVDGSNIKPSMSFEQGNIMNAQGEYLDNINNVQKNLNDDNDKEDNDNKNVVRSVYTGKVIDSSMHSIYKRAAANHQTQLNYYASGVTGSNDSFGNSSSSDIYSRGLRKNSQQGAFKKSMGEDATTSENLQLRKEERPDYFNIAKNTASKKLNAVPEDDIIFDLPENRKKGIDNKKVRNDFSDMNGAYKQEDDVDNQVPKRRLEDKVAKTNPYENGNMMNFTRQNEYKDDNEDENDLFNLSSINKERKNATRALYEKEQITCPKCGSAFVSTKRGQGLFGTTKVKYICEACNYKF